MLGGEGGANDMRSNRLGGVKCPSCSHHLFLPLDGLAVHVESHLLRGRRVGEIKKGGEAKERGESVKRERSLKDRPGVKER